MYRPLNYAAGDSHHCLFSQILPYFQCKCVEYTKPEEYAAVIVMTNAKFYIFRIQPIISKYVLSSLSSLGDAFLSQEFQLCML